ncbi:MAG: hypothetical protein OEM15_06455 [Myxococcales bacterium]|nr:hypothetical protein [Myxococcales bacterium]MDH3484346.1 hypothetical protein [Myxococcales bacterium]
MLFSKMFRLAAHRVLDFIELLLVRESPPSDEEPALPADRR